jgi:hypothetical protein
MANNTVAATEQEQSSTQPTKQTALKVRRHPYWDEYIGTADQLIEAGILQAGQFPGDPGRGKTMVSYTADGQPRVRGCDKGAGYCQVRRVSRTMFNVTIRVDKEEAKRRQDEERERRDNAKVSADAQAELKRQMERLKELPETPAQYAKRAADLFWMGYEAFHRAHCGDSPHESGYSFSARDAEDFAELARTLYWAIREAEAPKFNAQYRHRHVMAAQVKSAKADLPLQRLLRAASQKNLKHS